MHHDHEEAWLHGEYLQERIKALLELVKVCLQMFGHDYDSPRSSLPTGSSTLVLSTYKVDWIKGLMQLDVDTVSKMDLTVLPSTPKTAESVLSLKPGGFKINQISMFVDALQRILHLISDEHTSVTAVKMLREELMRARDIISKPQFPLEAYEIQRFFEPPISDLALACYVEEGEIMLRAGWPSNRLSAEISSVSPTLRASYLLIQTALNQAISLEHLCETLNTIK